MEIEPKRTRFSKLGGIRPAHVLILACSGLLLTFDIFIGGNAFRQIQAHGYSKAAGSVTRSEVVSGYGLPITYRPNIHYMYSVSGKKYLGDRYRYGQWSSGRGWARQTVASHPVGSPVDVYYAPGNPSDALLKVGIDGMDLYMAMLLLPFNIFMLMFWLALWILMWRAVRRRQPRAGGARIVEDGRCVRLRLLASASSVGVFVAAGLALVGTVVVGLGYGCTPPMSVMHIAWGVVSGGGVSAYLLQALRLAGGRMDLVIDDFRRSITLPPTLGRREALVIPAYRIVAIEVDKVEKRYSTGDVIGSHFPTVVYTDDDGSSRRERIADRSEDGAEGLAAWLRERLRIETPTSPPATSALDSDDARSEHGSAGSPSQG